MLAGIERVPGVEWILGRTHERRIVDPHLLRIAGHQQLVHSCDSHRMRHRVGLSADIHARGEFDVADITAFRNSSHRQRMAVYSRYVQEPNPFHAFNRGCGVDIVRSAKYGTDHIGIAV